MATLAVRDRRVAGRAPGAGPVEGLFEPRSRLGGRPPRTTSQRGPKATPPDKTRQLKWSRLIWLCLFLTVAGCAGKTHTGSVPKNTPGILDRWHFKAVVSDFEGCARDRLAERGSGPSGSGPVVRAMVDCREMLYRLYPAMEASGCCTAHYIEGYVQGSWGAVRRRLENKTSPQKGL